MSACVRLSVKLIHVPYSNRHVYLSERVCIYPPDVHGSYTSLFPRGLESHARDRDAQGRAAASTPVTPRSFLISRASRRAFPKPGGSCCPAAEMIAFPLSHLSNELIENQVTDLQNQDNNKIIMILLAIWPQRWFLLPEKHCHVNKKTHQSQQLHKSQANWLKFTRSIAGETAFHGWGRFLSEKPN